MEAEYWGATGKRQPGEVWRAGDFLGSALMAGDSNGKVVTFFPKLGSSPGGTSSLSPRGYCGLETISGIRRTRPRVQLLQEPVYNTSLKQVPIKLVKNSDAKSDAAPELSLSPYKLAVL